VKGLLVKYKKETTVSLFILSSKTHFRKQVHTAFTQVVSLKSILQINTTSYNALHFSHMPSCHSTHCNSAYVRIFRHAAGLLTKRQEGGKFTRWGSGLPQGVPSPHHPGESTVQDAP
jgi:hypothetical protein